MERMGALQEELQEIVGKQEAAHLVCEILESHPAAPKGEQIGSALPYSGGAKNGPGFGTRSAMQHLYSLSADMTIRKTGHTTEIFAERWFDGIPRAQTRRSTFTRLYDLA